MKLKLLALFILTFSLRAFADYQSQSALSKQGVLWQKTVASEYYTLPPIPTGGWGSIISKLESAFSLGDTYSTISDELPPSRGRTKLLHPSGSVVKVEFVPHPGSPFTGIFESGAVGLARFSLAGNPEFIGSYTPGIALKFLIDGRPSVNVAAMYELEGQGSNKNFFANHFSNYIPEPKGALFSMLGKLFSYVVSNPFELSVDHFASVTASGKVVPSPRAPGQLLFISKLKMDSNTKQDFRSELARISEGTLLYTIMAIDYGSAPVKVGYIYSRSRFVASEYGDHQLFFQHKE